MRQNMSMEEKVSGQGEGKKKQGICRVRGHWVDYLRSEKTKTKSCTKSKSEGKDLT